MKDQGELAVIVERDPSTGTVNVVRLVEPTEEQFSPIELKMVYAQVALEEKEKKNKNKNQKAREALGRAQNSYEVLHLSVEKRQVRQAPRQPEWCRGVYTQEATPATRPEKAKVKGVSTGKKYKKVADKVRPVLGTLPSEFRIVRNITGDPLEDLPELPVRPPEFQTNGWYT